jgi:hypothetical protein
MKPERDDLLEDLRRLERAFRPLEPGPARRRHLRDAIVAAGERYLRQLAGGKAYEETANQGLGLLDQPIAERRSPNGNAAGFMWMRPMEASFC